MLGKIIIAIIVILIIIQFIHPEKNIHPGPRPNAIAAAYSVPANVQTILEKACNDCHSNNTRYPWYNNIQPVAWMLNNHVQEGKEELNFDEFLSYPLKKKIHKMDEIAKSVKEGDMPLSSYLWIHKDARLTPEEKKALIDWAESLKPQMK